MNASLDGTDNKLVTVEKMISELEDLAIELIHSEA